MRDIGKESLKCVLTKEQNIDIIEKNIHDICDDDEETYKKYDEESKTRSKYRPNEISLRIIMPCYLKWMQLICQLNTEIL